MWLLISERGESFLVTPKQDHFVSRKGGSITLSDDQSISRQHAKLFLDTDDPNDDCGIILKDTSSKYGTYVNGGIETSSRIDPKEQIVLKHDDLVRFGLQWNTWRVVFMPLVVLTSTLKQEKNIVKTLVDKLGGKFLSNWSPKCTHLTMNNITLTIKVVSALGAGQHIVTPDYWQSLFTAIENKKGNLPDPANFVPPLNEATLNKNQVSFLVNKRRSELFKSLIFIASSPKQKLRIEPMIVAAGGKVIEFNECHLNKNDICKDGFILMQTSSFSSPSNEESQVPSAYLSYTKYLASKGLRCIPESDVGLSIVYCSCEKFCNPKYKPQSLFEHHPAPLEQTQSDVIVKETQENSVASVSGVTEKIIDETVVSRSSPFTESKRNKRSLDEVNKEEEAEDDNERRVFKKPALNGKSDKIDISSDKKDNKSPKSSSNDNDIFMNSNCTVVQDSHQEDDDCDNVSAFIYSSKRKQCSSKKINISDSEEQEDRNEDNVEFQFGSEKKRMKRDSCVNNNQILKEKKINENIVINCKEDDDEEFSLGSNKKQVKQTSVASTSRIIDSEQDIFSDDCKNDKIKCKIPRSVDIFSASNKSCVTDKPRDNGKSSLSLSVMSKRSGDIFDVTPRSHKKLYYHDDDDDYGNEFDFKAPEKDEKMVNVSSNSSSVFKTPVSVNENEISISNPFEINYKTNCEPTHDSLKSLSSSVNEINLKRRSSVEVEDCPPAKKPITVNIDDDDDDDLKNDNAKNLNSNFSSSNVNQFCVKREIKQEELDINTIKDEELHDATVVIVKSLIAPLRNVSICDKSSSMQKRTTVNFKKFRKATPIKMPEIIDVIPYKNVDDKSWNDTFPHIPDSDSDIEDDGGWLLQKSQGVKQNKKAISKKN